ncbi:MAG TPA: hypothetical protein ENJ85_05070 [Oceanithermus profundus]|uniref:Cyclic-phosphate processing Receiver domain-containing protein n=1 Tax=Oceanithermus profundus TaxID=187137 RepID=A0A7C5SSE0_9DEIN|nr:hypothetical protein [Oceanithermus profundus]
MKLWLDDRRAAPPGWTWITDVESALQTLRHSDVSEVSLDYDLEDTDPGRTGAEVIAWVWNTGGSELHGEMPIWHSHSTNPFGAAVFAMFLRALEGGPEPSPEQLHADLLQRTK